MERPEKVIVPDASVIDKWFVEEEHSDAALALREDYVARRVDIAAPELLPFEVLNSLRYNPAFGEQDLPRVAEALDGYCFWLFALEGDFAKQAVEKSLRYGISVYDASYVSLGEMKGADFYTADEKLLGKLGGMHGIHHISQYGGVEPTGGR